MLIIGFLKLRDNNDNQHIKGEMKSLPLIAKNAAKKADVVLLVVDASLPLTDSYKGMPVLLIYLVNLFMCAVARCLCGLGKSST